MMILNFRYGKVQSVKILPRKSDENNSLSSTNQSNVNSNTNSNSHLASSYSNGISATVAFIDIKSASKAHNSENKIEERTLKTDYYEPPASSTSSSAIFIHEREDAHSHSIIQRPSQVNSGSVYGNTNNNSVRSQRHTPSR